MFIHTQVGFLLAAFTALSAGAASTAKRYYAHEAVEDRFGVIAPWYKGQNGQFDYRVRIAAETLKRYPWVDGSRAVMAAPEYLYSGKWKITPQGQITVLPESDWNNGDLVQRAANAINAWERYYAYSGDPAAFTHVTAIADYLVNYCQTGAEHGWPRMIISVPTHGVRYGPCRLGNGEDIKENGKIQLDIAAETGLALVRAYEMTGNLRWYDTAKHWADLLARNRNRGLEEPLWGRYAANAGGSGMTGIMNGGVAFVLAFFDELIRTGYTGEKGSLIAARDDGRRYLRDFLLPAWTTNETFGHNYWDGPGPVQQSNVTEAVVQYVMSNPDSFPNWKNDVRNILGLFLNHGGADPDSAADVYSGAWAHPESQNCCANSLAYVPMRLAGSYARYAELTGSNWAREMGRRQQILATYDMTDTGYGEDLLRGGSLVYDAWFKIAHPMALRNVLGTMAWMPAIMGPNRENHIMRSSSVVRAVTYAKGELRYEVFDAPPGSQDVLRLAFRPSSVLGDGKPLSTYALQELPGGDTLVTIQRSGVHAIEVRGDDPQAFVNSDRLTYSFAGNQVRVIGRTGPSGGRADVFLDRTKQRVSIDSYTPFARRAQVLYYLSGLGGGSHSLTIVPGADRNPLSSGNEIALEGIEYSAATGNSGFGEGGGPTEPQRFIFGFAGRKDYVDSAGHAWRPGVEFVARTGRAVDPVARTWWVMPRQQTRLISGTSDPELYLYGIHSPELIINVTTAPGVYSVRLKFVETEFSAAGKRAFSIFINGEKQSSGLDLFAKAGGAYKPLDLVFHHLRPKNGIIEVRLLANSITGCRADAVLQALEVVPETE